MAFFNSKKKQRPVVILAGCPPTIHEKFNPLDADIVEVTTVRGALLSLERKPSLVVAAVDRLEEVGDLNRELLRQALKTADTNGVPVYTVDEFASLSDTGIITNLLSTSSNTGVRFVIPKVIMYASYSGGIGKSTLSISTARAFREITGLPAAVIESGIGSSILLTKVGLSDGPSLFEVMRIGAQPRKWKDVDLYPLSEREAYAMIEYRDFVKKLKEIASVHPLTIIDGSPNSPLWDTLASFVDEVIVVAAPRPDTILQARTTYAETREFWTVRNMEGKRVRLVANLTKNVIEKAAFTERVDAFIDFNEGLARDFSSTLGQPILEMLYPGLIPRSRGLFASKPGGTVTRDAV